MIVFEQIANLLHAFSGQDFLWNAALIFFPFLLFVEFPFYLIVISSVIYNRFFQNDDDIAERHYFPLITCIVCAYNEGPAILQTLNSLLEQLYPGPLEILVIIDGSEKINEFTQQHVEHFIAQHSSSSHRKFKLISKNLRGGHASSINLGLKLAQGEYILIIDGDTSCDNDALSYFSQHFSNKNIVGLSGTIRARNANENFLTRLQAIEYILGISFARSGLSAFNILNIISSAFGLFRRDFLMKIGGWKNGSAEDLDLTIRIQSFFNDHPSLKLGHDSRAVAHTEVPSSLLKLLKQRFRWEGDMFFILFRRHWRVIRPKFLGWRLFITLVWNSLLLHAALPITLLAYFAYHILSGHLFQLAIVLSLGYLYYFIIECIMFLLHVTLVSERKMFDLSFALFLPFMPIYQLLMRLWAGVSLIFEMIFKTHLDTTMAPYWVTRKTDEE